MECAGPASVELLARQRRRRPRWLARAVPHVGPCAAGRRRAAGREPRRRPGRAGDGHGP